MVERERKTMKVLEKAKTWAYAKAVSKSVPVRKKVSSSTNSTTAQNMRFAHHIIGA